MRHLTLAIAAVSLLAAGCKKTEPEVATTQQTSPARPVQALVFEPIYTVDASAMGQAVRGSGIVSAVISDRGFWIGKGEDRLFAVVREDVPRYNMIDIHVGERLELSGIVMQAQQMSLLAGTLEQDTRDAIKAEPLFLATHWAWIDKKGPQQTSQPRSAR